MATESQDLSLTFSLKGMVSKADPSKLGDGQYPYMLNLTAEQEGVLVTRSGRKYLGITSSSQDSPYMIRKLRVTGGELQTTPSTNPRYIGVVDSSGGSHENIYRTTDYSTFTKVADDVGDAGHAVDKRWNIAEYSAGSSGDAWAFIAAESKMLKDHGQSPYGYPLPSWGIMPGLGVATAVSAGAGNLDGGAVGSPAQTEAYTWIFVYVHKDTGNEGNPSLDMGGASVATNGIPLELHNEKATVTVWGTADTTYLTKIAIFRRGGLLTDTWRLVGYVSNPGVDGSGTPTSATFTDDVSDVDLIFGRQIEYDHDPPVTSTLASPFSSTVSGATATGGWHVVNLNSAPNVTAGSIVTFSGSATQRCVIAKVASAAITVYLQTPLANGDTATISYVVGQPCHLAVTAFDSVFVAGDPNNPHILYKSKPGQPEYFPLQTDAGTVNQIGVGSPSNGIVNMTEFRGSILCMNVSSFFEVSVLNGLMYTPVKTPCRRGLAARYAWCEVDGEIWYLAVDGIWSWDGSSSQKRSEAIDPIFHGKQTQGLAPIDFDPNALQWCQMEYQRGVVRLLYRDIGGTTRVLCCNPIYGDRWYLYNCNKQPGEEAITVMYREGDTGSLIYGRSSANGAVFSIEDMNVVSSGQLNFTNDEYSLPLTSPGNGDPIAFDLYTPWFDCGAPDASKAFEEILVDMDPQIVAGRSELASMTIELRLDYSTALVDSFSIPGPAEGRQIVSVLPNLQTIVGTQQAFGREARAIQLRFHGQAYLTQVSLFGMKIRYRPTGLLTAGSAGEWLDLGHKGDKKLYQMRIMFDTRGTDQSVIIDTISGRDSKTYNSAVSTFSLSNATAIPGTTRAVKDFPIPDGTVCKLVRVRPVSTAPSDAETTGTFFHIYSVDFDNEPYPPDIVPYTPWDTGGYEYEKYAQQVSLTVNTNNVAITVNVQADSSGANLFTFQVTATDSDRVRNITLPPSLKGKQWRIFVDAGQAAFVSGAGMFQLFSCNWRFQKSDPGEVGHTFDWDQLDHPWDKRLLTVTFEWDNTGNADVTLQLDILKGINGATLVSNVAQFVLTGGRSRKEFQLPADTIAKLVRIYPLSSPGVATSYKQWFKYYFTKTDYPPDVISTTEWKDFGSPNDKNVGVIWMDSDTENVAAAVVVENENGDIATLSHTGTSKNRKASYNLPIDKSGKMWRLRTTPGTNGKFQLWDWGADDIVVDPPDQIPWTPWNDFGWPCDKTARNLDITVSTNGRTVPVAIQADGVTVQTVNVTTTYTDRKRIIPLNTNLSGKLWRLVPGTIPSGGLFKLWSWDIQPIKEPCAVTSWSSYESSLGIKFWKVIKAVWIQYRCAAQITVTLYSDTGSYAITLPAHSGRSVERFNPSTAWTGGPNKSKIFRVDITSSSPFQLYPDSSGIEFLPLGVDRHSSYQLMTLSELMSFGV